MKPARSSHSFSAIRPALVALLATAVFAATALAQTAKLTVSVDQPGVKISPTLYGLFFEEINLAGDGGLYGEMVRNRSFEDSDKPDHWTPITPGASRGSLTVDPDCPKGAFNRRALRLKVEPGAEFRVGAANAGYFGMALEKDAVYELSLWAKGLDLITTITAALESADGKETYAEAKIEPLTPQWKQYTVSLTSKAADPKARLVLWQQGRPGCVLLDMVSLFPKKTWKDRPNGLRPDLAEMLAGLKPSFVRFPGGCWVEGDTMATAQRWKTTIGEPLERRTLWNLWQYHSTNGLGFHEYLQLCEDLKAEPLFVINVGMSHREVVPMDKMQEFVQDALDAIEYANGSVESKWGALRAKAGHPAPFNLKRIEIGNENGGAAYQERYALFHDAIRAKYPDVLLVGDEPTRSRPCDIVDEHYYSSPEFFISQAHRYDKYDRKGPKIYVGEYAVTQGCGQGNLRGAVGEAAFMTGMERNADIVVMASYAPLFANVNYKRWNPDLINFDSSRVYGLPSYYVQQMFSANRGDVVLPTKLEVGALVPASKPGAIGVGTWSTQAEFKDLRVTKADKTLLESDFAKGSEGWKADAGTWAVKDGALQQSGSQTPARMTAGDPAWTDYTLRLKARKISGAEGFLISFQYKDPGNWVWWNLGGWNNREHGLEVSEANGKSNLGEHVPGKIETGRWYDIRVELKGQNIKCYLDDKLVHDVDYGASERLFTVASRVTASGEIIVKVVNAAAEPIDTQVLLEGAKNLDPAGTISVLTSANGADENTLANPTKVAPKSEAIAVSNGAVRYTFPGNSVSVLKLKAAP